MAPSAIPAAAKPNEASNEVSAFSKSLNAAAIFPKEGPDATARSWSHSPSGITFAAQDKLPKQPLPSLESSCQRYLDAVSPLQSPDEHETTKHAVQTFIEGEGPLLQAQLEEYDRTHVNYFEQFCCEAFLGDESPVVLNSNAFCSYKYDVNSRDNSQIARATALTLSAVEFSQAIREDRLQPDDVRGVPQCSNQYWWLFGVARIPEDDGGRIRMDVDAKHIVVFCRGQVYRVDVLNASNEIVSWHDLSEALQCIVADSYDNATEQAVGLLTTENQKLWSKYRKEIVHEGLRNGRNLAVIDSSLFALCLDDSTPEQDSDICKNMICGTDVQLKGKQVGSCLNRWYDKLAVIVCANGASGMNFEHTCSDGSVDIRMACSIYEGSIDRADDPKFKAQTNGSNGVSHSSKPQKLQWDITASIDTALSLAQERLSARISAHQLAALTFRDFGTTHIKSLGFSPDAFFQLTLQATYYSTYSRIVSGFEPVVTRQFAHGRTDVVRTTTQAAVDFAKLYADSNASKDDKIAAMKKAAESHSALSKVVAKGGSHHRHLYVLQQMWKKRRAFLEASGLTELVLGKQPEATIFEDAGYGKLGTTVLMGSNVDNPSIAYAGFGPPGEQSFTVCYYIRKDHLAFSTTSRNGEAEKFTQAIERTLRDLAEMVKV